MYRIVLRCFFVSFSVILAMTPLSTRAETDPKPSKPEDVPSALEDMPDEERALLITIHPGTTLFERYGHTLLCLLPASAPAPSMEGGQAAELGYEPRSEKIWNSSCFDFGVFSEGSVAEIVTGSLRGQRMFRGQELLYGQAVEQYRLLDRTIEHQMLPFSVEKVRELRSTLEDILARGEGYAYHPFYNNCSTQVRDVLDEISGGELKASANQHASHYLSDGTFRRFAEEGFSGKVLTLMGVELLVGSSASQKVSTWQQGAFPVGLRDLVKQAWGIDAVVTYQQKWKPLPTSVHAGRLMLIFVGVLLAGWVYWSSRTTGRGHRALALASSGCIIAALGLLAIATRLYSHYPEFSSNFAPLVLFPGDATLAMLSHRMRKRYVLVRLAVMALLLFLSLISAIEQPLFSLVLFASLPLVASLSPGIDAGAQEKVQKPSLT